MQFCEDIEKVIKEYTRPYRDPKSHKNHKRVMAQIKWISNAWRRLIRTGFCPWTRFHTEAFALLNTELSIESEVAEFSLWLNGNCPDLIMLDYVKEIQGCTLQKHSGLFFWTGEGARV